jgi:uncharacterized protein involved in exopolysaccharide biosynthesis
MSEASDACLLMITLAGIAGLLLGCLVMSALVGSRQRA